MLLIIYCNIVNLVHGPKLTEEVLSHCVFQKELSEMLDKPAILKHLKQQVLFGLFLLLLGCLRHDLLNIIRSYGSWKTWKVMEFN